MNKPIGFDDRLQHSIELVRKSEKIALAYDPEDGFFLAFSGGKDSQALYHVAQMAGVKFKAHFSPTTVDPPAIIRFIRKNYPDCVFEKVEKSIFQRAVERGILPTQKVRWCCQDFKEGAGAGKVTLIGIRKKESTRRSKRNEIEISSRKFSGNMEQFQEYRKAKLGTPSVANPEAIENESTVGCIVGKESLLVSPIIYWSEEDVWYFLNKVVKVPHCELYDQGWHRLGCICCPMGNHKQKLRELAMYPHVKRGWINAIKKIREGGGYHKTNLPVFRPGYLWWNIPAKDFLLSGGGIAVYGWSLPQTSEPRTLGGAESNSELSGCSTPFSECPSQSSVAEDRENEIAENIFDWWISGKSYKKWYSDKFLQMKFDFDSE